MNKWRNSAVTIIALSWSLACYAKAAEDQPVAVVNGEEITLQDVDAQLAEMNLPASADKKAARIAIVPQLVKRKLIAQEARKLGLERDPVFLAQQRRANEELLFSAYAKRALAGVPVPDAAAISRFMADNPRMFAKRQIYKLDQIQFEMPANPASLKSLESAHSLDAVAQALTSLGVKFERGNGSLDSARIPAQMLQKILSLKKGEPFIVPSPQPGRGLANVITGSETVTVPEAEQRAMAVQALRNQALAKIGEQQLNEAKAKAKIDYQPGYGAPYPPDHEM